MFKAEQTQDGHCSSATVNEAEEGVIIGDADDLAVHDAGKGPKLMQRSAFSAELAEWVAREKLELAVKANAHAAKDLRRLAEKSAGLQFNLFTFPEHQFRKLFKPAIKALWNITGAQYATGSASKHRKTPKPEPSWNVDSELPAIKPFN
ncbi:hypothetical protein B0H14DRAFT_2559472 [Mycena olivaceomarginata]|nr:hypothetical protein B0H14DRAFT_2559472 [Mycena olivaceomarginata]